MKPLLPQLAVALGCFALACSERDAGWMVRPEGVAVGTTAEGVRSPALPSPDGSDLGLARAFFPELATRPGRPGPDQAKLLRVTARADGMEISTRGHVFRIRRLSGEGRPVWQPVDGEGADGLWVTSRIEELVVTEAGAAPYRERFEVTVPEGVVALRDAGDSLEFVDARNVPVLRMHHALARDEGGHWRQGRATVWGAIPAGVRGGLPAFALRGGSLEVELSVGFEGFAGQVVVDPGWSFTGAMNISRSYFTQTLLPTGQVLVAGGETSAGTTSSAELYDPRMGTWQSTGPMLIERSRHAATVLQDGRILVAGGLDAGGAVQATAELYDPAAGTWQATGSMMRPRSSVAATLLRSGKALVVGGPDSEIYDPSTATWGLTGPMRYATTSSVIAQLASGEVLAVGDGSLSQIYDPANDSWRGTGAPTRSVNALTLLASGKVLSIDISPSGSSASDLYDPASGTWGRTGASKIARFSLALLPSGKVLEAGSGAIYDPASGTWSPSSPSPDDPLFGAVTLLPSGKVLASAGLNTIPSVYDPGPGRWTATAALATARSEGSATQLPGGRVLIAGGQGASGPTTTAELYDPAARAWLPTGSMNVARSRHTATLLTTGVVLVVGGNGAGGPLADAEIYDPASGTWSATTSMAEARSGHTATLLATGAVLVAGGTGGGGILASAERFRPGSATWTMVGSMISARSNHTATRLLDDTVLIAGGQGPSGPLGNVELYLTESGSWRFGAPLLTPRTNHTATLLPSGRVLIAGGQNATGVPLPSTELYEPLPSGAWIFGGSMAAARSGHTATPSADGRVLVAGGMGVAGPLVAAEAYDEATDAWAPASALATARADASALLLANGKVLVAGGGAAVGPLASAELYDDTGASDAWRPAIAPIPLVRSGEQVTVTGSRLRGITEGSNGLWLGHSPSNVPSVKLLSLEGGLVPIALRGFSDTSLTFTVPPVPDGHYLLVETVNAMSAGAVVSIDGVPPAPTLTAPASFVSSHQPVIAGSAEAQATVTVAVDGTTLGDAYAGVSGSWSFIPASPLANGPHDVAARATNAFESAGPWSSLRSFVVDDSPPWTPGFSVCPAVSSSPIMVLAGRAEAYNQLTIWIDGVLRATYLLGPLGNWQLMLAPLPDGPHVATAQSTDRAGNISPLSACTFIIDTVPPRVPEIASPGSGDMVASPTPLISGTAEPSSIVTVTVDSSDLGMTRANDSGAWSLTSPVALAQGPHSLTAQGRDIAGNQSPAAALRLFTVDSIAPPPPVVVTPSEDAVEPSATPLVSGTAEVGDLVTIWLDGAAAGTVGTNDSGAWSFIPAAPLTSSAHTLAAQATDMAGNSSTSASRSFLVQPASVAAPELSSIGAVSTALPRISGTATPGDSVKVLLDGAVAGTVWPDQTGCWSFVPPSPLADGSHVASAQATDPLLNESPMASPVPFLVDTVAPPTPSMEAPGPDALVKTATPQLLGTAEPGSTVMVVLDGETAGAPTTGGDGAWTLTPTEPLADGHHAVTLQAADAVGNVSPVSSPQSFTIQRPRSYYRGGCSAAPAGGLGTWLLLLGLGPLRSARRRRLLARWRAPSLAVGLSCLGLACSPEDVDRIRDPGTILVGQAAEDVSSPGTRLPVADGAGALEVTRSFFPELAPKQAGHALNPARLLRVTRSADGIEIVSRGQVFHIRAFLGDDHRLWSPVDGDGAGEPWVTSRIEEYVVTEAGAAPYRERFEVIVPDSVVTLRDASDFLELDDAEDVPVLRMHHALARDERGHWRRGRSAIQGAIPTGRRGGLPAYALRGGSFQVELAVGFEGLVGTVVVDPGWSSTGAMSTPRSWFTQTLLPSGKVLVAGGKNGGDTLASAELYDPQTGTWAATSAMQWPRWAHAATQLLDGQALIAGGRDPSGNGLSVGELYDTEGGIWHSPSQMVQAHDSNTATLLPSGKVLVVGPFDSEIYDPTTATWKLTRPMVYSNTWGASTLLASGQVLSTSGGVEAQLYDPTNNAWRRTGSMSAARALGCATLLPSGKVLMVGGSSGGDTYPSSSELYDPASGTWSLTGTSQLTSNGMRATLLPSGKVLVALGSSSQTYDPAAGTWQVTESIGQPHNSNGATLLPSGKVLVTDGSYTTVPEVYDPGAGSWTVTPSQLTARSGASATQLPGGKVLVTGGQGSSGPTALAELYDPTTHAWLSTGSMGHARAWHTATLLLTGAVLVAGGTGAGGPLGDAELYDPVSGTWSPTSSLTSARSGHTATLLESGAILVTGGSGADVLASAELYHPISGLWTPARAMGAGRTAHTATKLGSGEVLVVGGQTGSGPLASTEVYDPDLDAWRSGFSLKEARSGHTATLLPSGHLLIVGGRSDTAPLASAEVCRAYGAWSSAGAMATARSGHSATLLANGKVLVAAGMGATGRLASAEVYDEGVAAWGSAGTLATARTDAAATLLIDGRVLVSGGNGAAGSLRSAELYEDTGASDAWRPSITALPPVQAAAPLTVSGQRFRGISEGSNGNFTGNSPGNVPVVRLLSLGGGSRDVGVKGFTDTSLTLDVPSVPEGYYLLAVTVNAISGGAVVFVDAPPRPPVLTAPAAYVASKQPTISGSAEPGSRVTVSMDGASLGDVPAAWPSGAWSLVPASPLAEGVHEVKARATDGRGLSGEWSYPLSFAVDTTPPAVPIFTSPGAVTGPWPALSGTSEPNIWVQLWVDGAAAGAVVAGQSGAWSLTVASPLGEGLHAATARAQDEAGNTSPISGARSFTVDATPPPPPEIVSPGSGAQVASRTPVISGIAESGSTVTVMVDGYVVGAVAAGPSGAWACTSSLALGEGAHGVTAQATDATGNVSPPTLPRSFTVDTIAPGPPAVLTPSEGAVESSERPLISGTAEAGSRISIWLDLALLGTMVTADTGAWSFVPASPIGAGTHVVVAEATDEAGNSTFSATPRAFMVQPTRPATPRILTPAGAVGTAFPAIIGKASSEDSVDVMLDGAVAGTAWPDEQGFWSFTPTSPLVDGTHVVAAQAIDSKLNASPMSDPVTLLVDTVAPPAPSLQSPLDDELLRTSTPRFAGTAEPGSTVLVALDGDIAGTARADDAGDWTVTPPRPLADGRHKVTLQARDAAGNVGSASSPTSFTVQHPRSFYGSGCSAAPVGGFGGWLLTLALWRSIGARRRAKR